MLLHRPRYRILEKRAAWDEEEEAKIWELLDTDPPVFALYSNFGHLLEIMIFRIIKTWLLSWMKEPFTLLDTDLVTGEHTLGPMKGLNYFCINKFRGDKMVKLSFEKASVREGTNIYMLQGK